jgi:hypothetical protein
MLSTNRIELYCTVTDFSEGCCEFAITQQGYLAKGTRKYLENLTCTVVILLFPKVIPAERRVM